MAVFSSRAIFIWIKLHALSLHVIDIVAEQKAELVRVSQSLLLVPNLHWVVVEDSKSKTRWVDSGKN
jgi:hypothetical protein